MSDVLLEVYSSSSALKEKLSSTIRHGLLQLSEFLFATSNELIEGKSRRNVELSWGPQSFASSDIRGKVARNMSCEKIRQEIDFHDFERSCVRFVEEV